MPSLVSPGCSQDWRPPKASSRCNGDFDRAFGNAGQGQKGARGAPGDAGAEGELQGASGGEAGGS